MVNIAEDLLEFFFLAEHTTGFRSHLLNLIQQHRSEGIADIQHIDLNVFEIDIDHACGSVVIQEIMAPCRDLSVPLDEFLVRLAATS